MWCDVVSEKLLELPCYPSVIHLTKPCRGVGVFVCYFGLRDTDALFASLYVSLVGLLLLIFVSFLCFRNLSFLV